ncbi:uncharacterized protein [Drosophila bipectinata]|uniref:uncharacterized protein n=1 Tax=Drosophila bipectinata TaxID=42026 RepID=UPI0038B3A63B
MEQLKALVKGRARLKANITRSLAWAEDAHQSDATPAEVSSRLEHLNTTWKEFIRFGDEIAVLDEVDGYVDPEPDNAFYEGKYLRAHSLLSAMAVTRPSPSTVSSENGSHGLQINNDAIISLLQQQQQLFEKLAADRATAQLPRPTRAYNTAWERLNERYNRPRHIVNSFMEQFMKLPTTTKSDAATLRKVSDSANEIVRGLDAIKETGRDCWIIYLAFEKLDAATRRRWIERSVESDSPTLEEFFKFLDARCEELELSKRETTGGKTTASIGDKTKKVTHSLVALDGNKYSKCYSTEHRLYGCPQFLGMSAGQRISFAKEKSLCYNCLKPGHGIRRCKSTFNCTKCKAQHHSLLHLQEDQLVVQAHVLGKITSSLERQSIDASALQVFNDLQLADSQFSTSGPVNILLGSEHVWSAITGRKIFDNKGKLIAISSIFGWVITSLFAPRASNTMALTTTVDIDATLRRFWELESIHRKAEVQPEDKEVEEHFLNTHARDDNGKYIVELPFTSSDPEFADTLQGALQRFKSVERRLSQNHQLRKDYVNFMRKYQSLGHMREISPSEIPNERSFYLPHHPVLGRKLRVVFDGSYRDAKGKALNDTLSIGPSIQRDLFAVCLRFRMHKYVFSADIVKMFRQIWVSEKHRNFQRIVWREDPSDPIKHFTLCTVTYGTSCAPFLAVRVLEQLAADHQKEFPTAAKNLMEDFYVDDVLTGSNSEDELQRNRDELVQLMSCAKLELGKWVSNTKYIVSEDNTDSSHSSVKVLGLHWHPKKDTLSYNVNLAIYP